VQIPTKPHGYSEHVPRIYRKCSNQLRNCRNGMARYLTSAEPPQRTEHFEPTPAGWGAGDGPIAGPSWPKAALFIHKRVYSVDEIGCLWRISL
jgi:hypothetical protein